MQLLEKGIIAAANFVWNTPLLILLLGGGLFFLIYSRLLPFRYFKHALSVLRGKHDSANEKGDISHLQALSSYLAATVGMGNITGVAIAIATGGPGVLFWMWISAFVGMASNYFTCTLAVMYRTEDADGKVHGGPMYVIVNALPKNLHFLAYWFSIAAMFGGTPVFQTNQIIQILKDVYFPQTIGSTNEFWINLSFGVAIMIFVGAIIFGGLKRISAFAERLVPFMVILYGLGVGWILSSHYEAIIPTFLLIFKDAFTAQAVLGGAIGTIIITGARRAAFSNEAGIGTAALMHGAAKTNEPVREGLVAMLGPMLDTIIVCTLTGLAILVTGVWDDGLQGISITTRAFASSIPYIGSHILMACATIFAITTIFGVWYYGHKATFFMFGKNNKWFDYWYVIIVLVGSVASLQAVTSLIDLMYGLMAFPTMISGIILAPKVMEATKTYFRKLDKSKN